MRRRDVQMLFRTDKEGKATIKEFCERKGIKLVDVMDTVIADMKKENNNDN